MLLDLPNNPDYVIVDVEAGGLFPDDGARIGCVGLAWPGGEVELPFDQGVRDKFPDAPIPLWTDEDPNLPREAWEEMFDWLERQRLVFHNAKYDLTMLEAGTREWPGRDLTSKLHWDTLIAQREIDPTEQVGLDVTAERLGIGRKADNKPLKTWLQKHGHNKDRYDLVPWDLIRPYLGVDLALTRTLYENQHERLDSDEFFDVEVERGKIERELEALVVFYRMEHRGVGYDINASLAAVPVLNERADRIEAGMPFKCDINSAKRWFCVKKGMKTDRTTEKGAPSLDEEQIRKWKHEGVEWAAEYEQVSKIRRAISMWYRGYPEKAGPDGRLRCYYKQAHVKSGRMSVQRIQLQAIPKADKAIEGVPNIRHLLRAREGCGLWNIDLQQAELRVAAKYAGCQKMLDMLLAGMDFHGETTKEVIKVQADHPLWKEKRDIAKRLTFGAIFQIGAEKFQTTLSKLADIQLSIEECEHLVYGWRNMYPEFGRAYYKCMRLFEHRGYVYLLPHTPYEIRSYMGPRDYPNTGWNRVVQGSLAEFLKLWLVEVERKWPGFMVLTVHDSIVLEAPLDEGDQLSAEVIERTVEMASNVFGMPMAADQDRWDKGVELPEVMAA